MLINKGTEPNQNIAFIVSIQVTAFQSTQDLTVSIAISLFQNYVYK